MIHVPTLILMFIARFLLFILIFFNLFYVFSNLPSHKIVTYFILVYVLSYLLCMCNFPHKGMKEIDLILFSLMQIKHQHISL